MFPFGMSQQFIFFCILFQLLSTPANSSELTLALADSTCETMYKVGEIFTQKTGIKLNYICKSSGLLAQGIKAGVIRADYFLSANYKWMTSVVEADLIDTKSINSLWGNLLVIASPASDPSITIESIDSLKSPEVTDILIGDPGTAPFGRYAKETMLKANIWDSIKNKIISRKKISLAVKLLNEKNQMGMVGFLYKTNVNENLRIDFVVPRDLYSPILYYSAPMKRSAEKIELESLLSFLVGKKASYIFRSAGFLVLD